MARLSCGAQEADYCYPSPCYTVILSEFVEDVADEMIKATIGVPGDVPDWYEAFEEQYRTHKDRGPAGALPEP